MINSILRLARTREFDASLDFYLVAAVVSGGRILSLGINKTKRSMFVRSYFDSWQNTHAELDAIRRVRRKIDLSGTDMYVIRIRKGDGSLGLARPCDNCMRVMRSYGIRRAVYTDDDGMKRVERVPAWI